MSKATLALSFAGFFALGLSVASCGIQSPFDKFPDATNKDFSRYQLFGNDLPDKTITLTFDDGPGGRTLELAQYLYNEGIKATFFVVGANAAGQESILRSLKTMGHLVANHSHRHQAMTSVADPVEAVRSTDNIIAPYTTGNMFIFRAPYGDWSGRVSDILNSAGLTKYIGSVFWDIGGTLTSRYSADWACWGQNVSVAYCGEGYLNEIADKRKGIVLMHDVHSRTVDMVKWMVPQLKERGYKFVRLDAVPNIAQRIREAGGSPGAGVEEKKVLGKIECTEGFALMQVGSVGGVACANATHVAGPFTTAMRNKCVAWGGGMACENDVWSKVFALKIRGSGACPMGAVYDSQTKYCVEGSEALGPFPAAIKQRCMKRGNDESLCESPRLPKTLLASLLQ